MAVGYSSACSSAVATGSISLSTKSRIVLRISAWTSVRPSVSQSRPAMSALPVGGRLPDVATSHAGGPSLGRHHERHLAGCLVDHLVSQHRCATRAASRGREELVGVEDVLRKVVVALHR